MKIIKQNTFVLLALLLVSIFSPVGSMAEQTVKSEFEAIVAAEKVGDWDKVKDLIDKFNKAHKTDVDKIYEKHLKKAQAVSMNVIDAKKELKNVRQAKADAYVAKADGLAKAEVLVKKAQIAVNKELDLPTDKTLRDAVDNEKEQVDNLIRNARVLNGKKYDLVLKLEEKDKYAKAVTKMDEILAQERILDADELAKYQRHKIALEQDQFVNDNPGFWQGIRKSVVTDLKNSLPAILWVLAIFALYILYRIVFRPFRKDFMEIGLEDQASSDGDKNELDVALSLELDQALKRIVNEINRGGELDGLLELGAGQFSSQAIGKSESNKITQYMDSNTIQVGIFKFTPKSLFDMLAYMTRTRGQSIVRGALFKEGTEDSKNEEYILNVETIPRNKNKKSTDLIYLGRAKTREEVIKQVAMQMVVKQSETTVTREWRSLDAMIKGKEFLDKLVKIHLKNKEAESTPNAGDDKDQDKTIRSYVEKAQEWLETSLAIDPSNWVARYRLANLMQRAEDYERAYWQYNYVLDLLFAKNEERNDNLYKYAQNQPVFPFLLCYKKISAISNRGTKQLKYILKEQRLAGLEKLITCLVCLKLLAHSVENLCSDEGAKGALGLLQKYIEEIFSFYKNANVAVDVIIQQEENNNSKQDLEKTETPNIGLTKLQLANIESTFFAKNLIDVTKLGVNFGKSGPEGKKIIVTDLVFQLYAGVMTIISALYEYHIVRNDTEVKDISNELNQKIEDIETWFYKQRETVNDKNRSAYAYSHAICHNARGRTYYFQFKKSLSDEPVSSEDEKYNSLVKLYTDSERFLRWAIGYHLPASFPEPYINLALLYIKTYEHENFRKLLPYNWAARAQKYLATSLKVSAGNNQIHYLMGRIYQLLIDDDEVLQQQDNTNDGKSNKEKALAEFDSAENNSFSCFRAGEIYTANKEYEKAMQYLKKCMKIYQRYDEPHQLYFDVALKYLKQEKDGALNDSNRKDKYIQKVSDVLAELEALNKKCIHNGKVADNDFCCPRLNANEISKITNGLLTIRKEIKQAAGEVTT